MSGTCVFCAIIDGEAPASMLYSDEEVVAFMDTYPMTPGHALVVPTAHAASIFEVENSGVLERMMVLGRQVAAAQRAAGVRMDSFNLFLADGEAAGQTVAHAHLHVIPRFPGDGLGITRPKDSGVASRSELDQLAERIRERWESEASP